LLVPAPGKAESPRASVWITQVTGGLKPQCDPCLSPLPTASRMPPSDSVMRPTVVGRRKRGGQAVPIPIIIALSTSSPAICSFVLTQLLEHLAYDRGLCPVPVADGRERVSMVRGTCMAQATGTHAASALSLQALPAQHTQQEPNSSIHLSVCHPCAGSGGCRRWHGGRATQAPVTAAQARVQIPGCVGDVCSPGHPATPGSRAGCKLCRWCWQPAVPQFHCHPVGACHRAVGCTAAGGRDGGLCGRSAPAAQPGSHRERARCVRASSSSRAHTCKQQPSLHRSLLSVPRSGHARRRQLSEHVPAVAPRAAVAAGGERVRAHLGPATP
jgi:hypothetical protein